MFLFNFNHFVLFRGFNTEVAMRKAKENVEKHYAVVGVLEELNKTLTVLEHYVPRFFKGAKDVYWSKNISFFSSIFSTYLMFQMKCRYFPRLTGIFTNQQQQKQPKTL